MIGVDEVGRGCWAGPLLVVAARASGELPPGLKDSKLMTKKQREAISQQLLAICYFGEGWVSAAEIDKAEHVHAAALRVMHIRFPADIGIAQVSASDFRAPHLAFQISADGGEAVHVRAGGVRVVAEPDREVHGRPGHRRVQDGLRRGRRPGVDRRPQRLPVP